MVRFRLLSRLVPVAALLSLLVPLTTIRHTTAATADVAALWQAPAQRPVLTVPRALLRTATAVPVIVEMNSPAQTLLAQTPGLQRLLAGIRGHLLAALHADGARNVYAYHIIPAIAATVPGNKVAALLGEPGVRAVVLDQLHPLPDDAVNDMGGDVVTGGAPPSPSHGQNGTNNTPTTVEPESYDLTRANVAQAHGYTGAGVRVAIIDSGLDITQPDLKGVVATDAQGRPLRVDFTGTGLQDTVGHGTACASMIASQGRVLYSANTRFEQGKPLQVYPRLPGQPAVYESHFHVYGMAPGVRIMSAKIFDTRIPGGGGYDSIIVRAIEWAIANHADVISESFGGVSIPSDGTDPVSQADEAAIRAGITVVAANGNAGPGQTTVGTPAAAPGVIAVGASTDFRAFGQSGFLAAFGHTTADNIAAFSSRGPTTDGRARPDLVAPGDYGWALFPLNKSEDGPTHPPFDVGLFGGTSQATPVTAGAAALVVEAFERTHGGARPSPALVRTILMSSAHDLGFPAFDQGSGRVDAWQAVLTTVHSGPSFLLGSEDLSIAGPTSSPVNATFALTNSGSTTQHYTLDAALSQQTGLRRWSGTVHRTALKVYHFAVTPGMARIVGSVYWHSNDRFTVQGVSKEVALRVALYDPLGRFTNYAYGVASGYASVQVSDPMPGLWSLVVSQNGRLDNKGIRRYIAQERFQASLASYISIPYGTLSPRAVTLAPGQSTHITLRGATPRNPGMQGVTIHVQGDHTAALPVVLTSYITLGAAGGAFKGVFKGGEDAYFSLTNENKVYALNVAPGTRSLRVELAWPNQGYGVLLLLIDPTGQIVDAQFNGIGNGNNDSPFDLRAHNLDAIWSNPTPGRWQIMVMDAVFAGRQQSEPFTGRVTLNDDPVTPLALSHTVLPGGSFNVTLNVRNDNGPNVAEGYVGYATTDSYSLLPLGEIHGPFGPAGITGTSIYTYSTGFVPPGTRMVLSTFAAVHPAVPIDLDLYNPIYLGSQLGHPAPVAIDGHTYHGTVAAIAGRDLPIGRWGGMVILRRPSDVSRHGGLVGASYADALTPLSWALFDHGLLRNGKITGGQPLILLPRQRGQLHANVTVPLSTPPGVYHAHLFVFSVFADQVADIPLTIVVQAHSGIEPEDAPTTPATGTTGQQQQRHGASARSSSAACAAQLYGVPTCSTPKGTQRHVGGAHGLGTLFASSLRITVPPLGGLLTHYALPGS